MSDYTLDPRYLAAVDLLQRTGMSTYRVGHSDEGDGLPVIWYAVATYGRLDTFEVAAGHDPVEATLRLCDQLVDGGTCKHCARMTVFDAEHPAEQLQLDPKFYCVYAWDPELKTFRRSCEGDEP